MATSAAAPTGKVSTAATEPAPAGKSKKKLIIIAAALVVLLGGGAGAFFVLRGGKPAEGAEHKAEAKKAVEYVSGDPYFTVNLADDDADRYLQLGLIFEVSDKRTPEALKEKMPVIRSDILLLLGSKKSREIMSMEGKKQLAAEILQIARKPLEVAPPDHGIDGVHFSIFVIQ